MPDPQIAPDLTDDQIRELVPLVQQNKVPQDTLSKLRPSEKDRLNKALGRAEMQGTARGMLGAGLSMGRELVTGAPKSIVSMVGSLKKDPTGMDLARSTVEGLHQVGEDIVSGDPEKAGAAVGDLLSGPAYGAAIAKTPATLKSAAEFTREHPNAVGGIAGAAAGYPFGTAVGHPYLGLYMGRSLGSALGKEYLPKLLGSPEEAVEATTPAVEGEKPVFSPQEIAALKKQGYPDAVIEKLAAAERARQPRVSPQGMPVIRVAPHAAETLGPTPGPQPKPVEVTTPEAPIPQSRVQGTMDIPEAEYEQEATERVLGQQQGVQTRHPTAGTIFVGKGGVSSMPNLDLVIDPETLKSFGKGPTSTPKPFTPAQQPLQASVKALTDDGYGAAEVASKLKDHPEMQGLTETQRVNKVRQVRGGEAGQLPARAKAAIDAAIKTLTTDAEKQAYLLKAGSGPAYNYVKAKLGL